MRTAGTVVVGYEATPTAGAALDWAAGEARRLRVPLTVLHVHDHLGLMPGAVGAGDHTTVPDDVASATVQEGVLRAGGLHPGLDVQGVARVARVADTLVEQSREARMLVVGTRLPGALGGRLLGSIAFQALARAQCPVVVVPEGAGTAAPELVVVGTDGSAEATRAVRFAAEHAADSGVPLVVVSAYRYGPAASGVETILEEGGQPHFQAAARARAFEVVQEAVAVARKHSPGLEVEPRVEEGSPAHVLRRCTEGRRAVLVVGSRRDGGFASHSLGSVTYALVHTANGPMAVVPSVPSVPAGRRSASRSAPVPVLSRPLG